MSYYLDSNVLQVPGVDSNLPFPPQPVPPGSQIIPSYYSYNQVQANTHHNVAYSAQSPLSNANLVSGEVVKLSCENVKLRDELNEMKAKLQMSLHDDKKRDEEDSDVVVLWSKKRKRKRKRKSSKVRSKKSCEKITQTKEFYNPREYNSLKFKCEVYKEQCLELRRKRISMLETSASKTAARLRAKSHQLSTLKSKHQKLKRSNVALANEKQKLADKLDALGRECVSAEQRQKNGVNTKKERQLEQLGNETKQLSILLSEKTDEVNMLRHAALEKMKQKVQNDQQITKLEQMNKRLQTTNRQQMDREKTELGEKIKEMELNVSEIHDSVCRATNQLAQLQHTNASVVYENDLLRKQVKDNEALLNGCKSKCQS